MTSNFNFRNERWTTIVSASIGSVKFVIGSVYIPPLALSLIYESHLQSVESVLHQHPNNTHICCGDYNLPGITWDNNENGLVYSFSSTSISHCIPETFEFHSFYQKNNIVNNNDSLLDLIFCNKTSLIVEKSVELIVPIDLYHLALCFSIPFNSNLSFSKRTQSFFNFRKAKFSKICSYISSFDWTTTFLPLDLDSAFNSLYDALHKSILDFVPCHFETSSFPHWFTKYLKLILSLKK